MPKFTPGCDLENESMKWVRGANGSWRYVHVAAIDTYEDPVLPGALPVHHHDEGFVPMGKASERGTTGRSNG